VGFKLADLFIEIGAKGISGVESQLTGLRSVLSSTGAAALGLGGIMTVGSLGAGLAYCVKAFGEAEQAGAKLDAVLRATNYAAGLSGAEISDLASDLQRTTVYEDDATRAAAAMLATFTEIKGDVFKEALKSAQNLSTVMGQDLRSSVMQIGKALQDPVTGILALRRAGVSFNETQREMIAQMVRSGRQMEAQKMILAELNREFGGAAAAEADTMVGRITQMKNAWGDMAETVGGKVAPALKSVAETLRDMAAGPVAPVAPERVENAARSGKLSEIRAAQKALIDEERAIADRQRGAYFGMGRLPYKDEEDRLKEIKRQLAALQTQAEEIGPTEFKKNQARNAAISVLGVPGGAPPISKGQAAQAIAGVFGGKKPADDEDAEFGKRGQNAFKFFEKLAGAQRKVREEGQRLIRDAMTPIEKYNERLSEIDRIAKSGGLTPEEAGKARGQAADDLLLSQRETGMKGVGGRFAMNELANNIQDSINRQAAEEKNREDQKKARVALEKMANSGVKINNMDDIKVFMGE